MHAPPAPPPSRLYTTIAGTVIFAVMLPLLWSALALYGASHATTSTGSETAGLAGFLMAGVMFPVGAVLGLLVSVIGDPARARRRWGVTAVIAVALSLSSWLWMFRG